MKGFGRNTWTFLGVGLIALAIGLNPVFGKTSKKGERVHKKEATSKPTTNPFGPPPTTKPSSRPCPPPPTSKPTTRPGGGPPPPPPTSKPTSRPDGPPPPGK
jgi:hypothetical protein